MTRYWSIELSNKLITLQFRHRLSPDGPVMYLSTHNLINLQLGHKYFIEVAYYGNQKELIKIQDEGIYEIKSK